MRWINFNSTIVRLRPLPVSCLYRLAFLFQFYNSAIKTPKSFELNLQQKLFQFYNSAIKTKKLLIFENPFRNFNSTIVRLRHNGNAYGIMQQWSFQFYNSAIKTLKDGLSYGVSQIHFNSTIVRLRQSNFCIIKHLTSLFQFYNSAIKTYSCFFEFLKHQLFQFYNSAIKTKIMFFCFSIVIKISILQ